MPNRTLVRCDRISPRGVATGRTVPRRARRHGVPVRAGPQGSPKALVRLKLASEAENAKLGEAPARRSRRTRRHSARRSRRPGASASIRAPRLIWTTSATGPSHARQGHSARAMIRRRRGVGAHISAMAGSGNARRPSHQRSAGLRPKDNALRERVLRRANLALRGPGSIRFRAVQPNGLGGALPRQRPHAAWRLRWR